MSWGCHVISVGVYVEEGRGNRDAIEEMPRIQLNSRAVPAFCVGSRVVGHDLHVSHAPRLQSADGSGDNAVKIKLREGKGAVTPKKRVPRWWIGECLHWFSSWWLKGNKIPSADQQVKIQPYMAIAPLNDKCNYYRKVKLI
ncbi:uncharacterized protein TNCV_3672601 [Trichonephila clavipes]|nr:uncharacterized protein TNCV_3672601 [Trichonephila clavipes]